MSNLTFQNEFYYNKHGIKFITFCPSGTKTNFAKDFSTKITDAEALQASIGIIAKGEAQS